MAQYSSLKRVSQTNKRHLTMEILSPNLFPPPPIWKMHAHTWELHSLGSLKTFSDVQRIFSLEYSGRHTRKVPLTLWETRSLTFVSYNSLFHPKCVLEAVQFSKVARQKKKGLTTQNADRLWARFSGLHKEDVLKSPMAQASTSWKPKTQPAPWAGVWVVLRRSHLSS